jgi:hypothetical protein
MPQNFVAIQNTSYKVLTQCTVWKIRCVDRDEWWRIEVGRTSDARRMEVGRTSDKIIEWQNDKTVEWQNDGTAKWQNGGTVERQNGGMAEWENETERNDVTKRCNETECNCADASTAEQFVFASSMAMAWKREKKNVFILLCVFFLLFSSFSSSRAVTKTTHYMITSLKTHMSAQPRC